MMLWAYCQFCQYWTRGETINSVSVLLMSTQPVIWWFWMRKGGSDGQPYLDSQRIILHSPISTLHWWVAATNHADRYNQTASKKFISPFPTIHFIPRQYTHAGLWNMTIITGTHTLNWILLFETLLLVHKARLMLQQRKYFNLFIQKEGTNDV